MIISLQRNQCNNPLTQTSPCWKTRLEN